MNPKDRRQSGEVHLRLRMTGPDSKAQLTAAPPAAPGSAAQGGGTGNGAPHVPQWAPQGASRRGSNTSGVSAGSLYAMAPLMKQDSRELVEVGM